MDRVSWQVLIAHAETEEGLAEQLAARIRAGGYQVVHTGTVMIGDSVVEEASRVLGLGGPVVLCGTIRAVGTGWAGQVVTAARRFSARVFVLQMEEAAYVNVSIHESDVALSVQTNTGAKVSGRIIVDGRPGDGVSRNVWVSSNPPLGKYGVPYARVPLVQVDRTDRFELTGLRWLRV